MGDCDYGVCGDCNGMSAGIRVIYTGPKCGGKVVSLFDVTVMMVICVHSVLPKNA